MKNIKDEDVKKKKMRYDNIQAVERHNKLLKADKKCLNGRGAWACCHQLDAGLLLNL